MNAAGATSATTNAKKGAVKKAVLAYSGGLDTSVILLWLREEYGCEVVAFTADIGQGEETETARQKAVKFGAVETRVEDLREVFASEYVFPMLRANAVYEHGYLLGTSIARPLIAKRQAEIAAETGADALAHGATGKGNDQVRFELAFLALAPDIRIIAPWREWDLLSRRKLMDYARARNVPIEDKRGAEGKVAPYSMDANLLHISFEGGELEDPAMPPPADMWRRTRSIADAPNDGEEVCITFLRGDPVAVDGKRLTAAAVIETLNAAGGKHGIGRADIVENRYVGLKSRGCYETPGGDILHTARRALETITLDREVMRLRAELMPKYAEMVYNGYWWSPERKLLQTLFDESQKPVSGEVRLLLHKGNATIIGRESGNSLYDQTAATFEDDAGAYDQRDAEGFIRLNALRLRQSAKRKG